MKKLPEKIPVVFTNKAKCRDCNRCVRVCPVYAIRIKDGQANVVPERCIACGTCITECPQGAKSFVGSVEKVLNFIDDKEFLIASIAPSFAAYFSPWEQSRLASTLRKIGFSWISETAVGASYIAKQTIEYIKDHPEGTHITTACPAIVNYIELYEQEFVKCLVPVVSPMIAHARLLKRKHGFSSKVVFIGPCIAKKDEAQRSEYAGLVDAVLTFSELRELLDRRYISLSDCEESLFDEFPDKDARLFPIEGGLLKTAKADTDIMNSRTIAISGFSRFNDAISTLLENKSMHLTIEPLFCEYGCINGPDIRYKKNFYLSRYKIQAYNNAMSENTSEISEHPNLDARYLCRQNPRSNFTVEQINDALHKAGKINPEDLQNCGACGYKNCTEKAIAVLDGLAEPEMCIPYMRRLAEKRNDLILQTDPNGIVVLNQDLEIIQINQAFEKMFSCSDQIIGRKISYLLDPEPFEVLLSGFETQIHQKVRYPNYNLICHQIVYKLEQEKQIVGIFVNITDSENSEAKLKNIKTDTILQAEELIQHQIKMAQELVRFLGENTAKGEVLLSNLIKAIEK